MKLTPENKVHIDSLSLKQLLGHWRFAPVGDHWFQDETGKYWGERMAELRKQAHPDEWTAASKTIGWDK